MIKLGTVIPCLKKIQKIYESRDTSLEFCWYEHFFNGNRQILLYYKIQIDCILAHHSFNFFWVFKDCFNKHGYNFDDASKGIEISYDVITAVHGVTNKILSCDSNYIVNVVMWPKFGNSSISMRAVMITQFYKDLIRKSTFFEW